MTGRIRTWLAALPRLNGLVVGGLGGAAFQFAGFPAGWLCGAIITTTLAATLGMRVESIGALRVLALAILGVAVGSKATPQVLDTLAHLPLSLLFLAVAVLSGHALNRLLLERVAGWDARTSRFAAVPGSLFVLLGALERLDVDKPRLVAVHLVRLFVIALSFPLLIGAIGDGGVAAPPRPPGEVGGTVAVLLASGVGAWLLDRLRVPAGALLGSLVPSALLHATGVAAVPGVPALLVICYVVLGAHVGGQMRLVGASVGREALLFGLGTAAIAIGTAASMAWLASRVLGQSFGQLLLSYAPGGMEVMAMLALVFHFDAGLTAAHQLTRYFAFILLLPWMLRAR